jgi:hypothetical protein
LLEQRLAPTITGSTLGNALYVPMPSGQSLAQQGTLANPNQVDLYAVQLKAGDQFVADASVPNGSNLQAALRIFDSSGNQVAFQESTGSGDTSASYLAPAAGLYYVGVSSNGDYNYSALTGDGASGGLTSGAYTLNLSVTSHLVVETPPNFTTGTAQYIGWIGNGTNPPSLFQQYYGYYGVNDVVVQGTYVSGTTEYYVFYSSGGGLNVSVTPTDASALLPQLTLYGGGSYPYGAAGPMLIQSDATGVASPTAQLNQNLPTGYNAGYFFLGVSAEVGTGKAGNLGYILNVNVTPSLSPSNPLPVGYEPVSVASGDFNHDGNLDLVTANSGAGYNDVSVLLGNGDGTFQGQVGYSTVQFAYDSYDGYYDIPVGGYGPVSVAVGDLRGDGNLDIVTANRDNTVSVLLGNGDGTFQPAVTYSITDGKGNGYTPETVTVGDLNGHLDIVVADVGDNRVSVLLGDGTGAFKPAVTYSAQDAAGHGKDTFGVTVANIDGRPDVITANWGDNTVSVLSSNADGTLNPAATYSVERSFGSEPVSVAVANFNGLPDIVTANFGDNTVSVLLGNADGSFQTPVTYAAGTEPQEVDVGTFGGRLSIVSVNKYSDNVSVLLGNGDGTFQSAVNYGVGNQPMGAAIGNFTHDGNEDIAVADEFASNVTLLLGHSDGTFAYAAQRTSVGQTVFGLTDGYFTHGGNLDLVTANGGNNTISVLLGNGDGTFQPAVSYAVGLNPVAVAVGDFNGDGNTDIVTANYEAGTVTVMLGLGDGTFLPDPFSTLGLPAGTFAVGTVSYSEPYGVAVGDFNGHLGIVTADFGDNTISVLLGKGDGSFQPAETYSVQNAGGQGIEPRSVAVGQIAGALSIVTANYGDDTVSVFRGKGDGTFGPPTIYAVGGNVDQNGHPIKAGANSVALGNFNGQTDIVTSNSYIYQNVDQPGTVSVLLGNSDGTFQPAVNYNLGGFYSAGQGPHAVAVGDFTGNGNLDIATADSGYGNVSILVGNGDGSFQAPVIESVGSSVAIPIAIAVGDFNNDGHPDIATANQGDGSVSVLISVPAVATYPVGKGPDSVQLGYDANGNYNIVTANAADNSVTVMHQNAGGTFTRAGTFSVGRDPVAVAFGYNNEGRTDIVTANAGDNTVSVLQENLDGSFSLVGTYAVGNDPTAVAMYQVFNYGTFSYATYIVSANTGSNTVTVLEENADGTFSTFATYAVGSRPDAVTMATDTNYNLDIITANAGDGTIMVLQQSLDFTTFNYSGPFSPVGTYAVGKEPSGVAVFYTPADNYYQYILSIVTSNAGDNTVSVLSQNNDGSFSTQGTYAVGIDPTGVATGYDNHGNLDIVTSNAGDNTVSVLQQNLFYTFYYYNGFLYSSPNGNYSITPVATDKVGSRPLGIAMGENYNNGSINIVTANSADNTISVLSNVQFQAATPENGVQIRGTPYLQDLTGNKDAAGNPIADELILDSSGDLLFRQGNNDGTFAPPVTINPGQPARDATVFQTAGGGWAIAAIDATGSSVSIYTWSAVESGFVRTVGFSAGTLPVRIAVSKLTGKNGLDDLVVANQLDNTVTIALQQPDGTFDILTRNVGAAPSDITFGTLGGGTKPAIIVSDQLSGDVTVLLNDGTTFQNQMRFRAGSGPFDITNSLGTQIITSQLQTVGVVAGNFTGVGSTDVIALNRGAQSFTLLPGLAGGALGNAQTSNTVATSSQPAQIISVTLPGDQVASVAVLMADQGQVWIYRNNGDGTFADPIKINAGDNLTGMSVATINGTLALLVGNSFGDILTLVYDGNGSFAPQQSNLGTQLAVGETADGQKFVVVAEQQLNQVALYYVQGNGELGAPLNLANGTFPLLAPGAVQTFTVPGDANPYLAVANSVGNDVLVYHYDPAKNSFLLVADGKIAVGDDPVSIAVANIQGNGIPDLLVANHGSNDVSVLIGSVSADTGAWTATPYQRLNSGGSGPLAVAFDENLSELMVTNSDGTVVTLPEIGTTGFFKDINPTPVSLGEPIAQALFADGKLFVLSTDGSLSELVNNQFNMIGQNIAAIAATNSTVFAALKDGALDEFSAVDGTLNAEIPSVFSDSITALAVLESAGGTADVFALPAGSDVPGLFVIASAAPGAGEISVGAANLSDSGLVAVATLLTTDVVEAAPGGAVGETAGPAFGLFVPPSISASATTQASILEDTEDHPWGVLPAPGRPSMDSFLLGIRDALDRRLERQQINDRVDTILQGVDELLHQLPLSLVSPTPARFVPAAAPQPNAHFLAIAQGVPAVRSDVPLPAQQECDADSRDGPAPVIGAEVAGNGPDTGIELELRLAACLVGSLLAATPAAIAARASDRDDRRAGMRLPSSPRR